MKFDVGFLNQKSIYFKETMEKNGPCGVRLKFIKFQTWNSAETLKLSVHLYTVKLKTLL